MSKYKLTEEGVFDNETFMSIPKDRANRFWRQYLEWAAIDGNEADPIATLDERKKKKVVEMEHVLNKKLETVQSPDGDKFDLAKAIFLVDKSQSEELAAQEKDELKALRSRFMKIMGYRQKFAAEAKKVLEAEDTAPEEFRLVLDEDEQDG